MQQAAEAKAAQDAAAHKVAQDAAAKKEAAHSAAAQAHQTASAARDTEAGASKGAASLRSMFENKAAQERAEVAGLPKATSSGVPAKVGSVKKNAMASRWEQTIKGNSK